MADAFVVCRCVRCVSMRTMRLNCVTSRDCRHTGQPLLSYGPDCFRRMAHHELLHVCVPRFLDFARRGWTARLIRPICPELHSSYLSRIYHYSYLCNTIISKPILQLFIWHGRDCLHFATNAPSRSLIGTTFDRNEVAIPEQG